MAKSGNVCALCVLAFSILCIVTGIVILAVGPKLIHDITEENVVLSNEGIGYGFWKDIPFPIVMQFWVWNLTNPDDVMNGAKPYIEQIGPYTYRETRDKTNITFDATNDTVAYIAPQVYVFDRERSVGDPKDDKFTTINVPYITVVNQASFWGFINRGVVQVAAFMTKSEVFREYTVYDFIWGYTDPLLVEIAKIKPAAVPTTFFGVFAGRNNSHDGTYVVYTGRTDSTKINIIQTFNGMHRLPYWSMDEANMVNGTDGTFNPPFVQKDIPGYVFSSDICRSIKSVYEQEIDILDIPTYRFVGPPDDFSSAFDNPDNAGFCTPDMTHCLPGGLLNVSNCQQNAPVVMSLPHFLYTEKVVLDMIADGLAPNKDEHQTFFDIEPNTGAPLRINKRLQINVHVKKYSQFIGWKHLPEVYLPVVWINESSCITEQQQNEFQWLTVFPKLITTAVSWGLICIGLLVIIIGGTAYFVKRNKERSPYDPTDERSQVINSEAAENAPTERTPLLNAEAQ